jgi:hypothetical protein
MRNASLRVVVAERNGQTQRARPLGQKITIREKDQLAIRGAPRDGQAQVRPDACRLA